MRPTNNNVQIIGTSGSGKSYWIVDWLAKEILPYTRSRIITNLPLGIVPDDHMEPPNFLGETFVDRLSAVAGFDLSDRVFFVGAETSSRWKNGQGGPWELGIVKLPQSTYLILDEFSDICHKFHDRKLTQQWINWFGKARHLRCFNLCITQTKKKVPPQILAEFSEIWQFSQTSSKIVPGLNVPEGDLDQFRSKFLGESIATTQVIVRTDEGGTIKALRDCPVFRTTRRSAGYRLYDSFSSPDLDEDHAEDDDAIEGADLEPWQTHNWLELLGWFSRRNPGALFKLGFFIVLFIIAGMYVFGVIDVFPSKTESAKKKLPSLKILSKASETVGDDPVSDYRPQGVVGFVGGREWVVNGDRRGLFDPSSEGEDIEPEPDFRAAQKESGSGSSGSAKR